MVGVSQDDEGPVEGLGLFYFVPAYLVVVALVPCYRR